MSEMGRSFFLREALRLKLEESMFSTQNTLSRFWFFDRALMRRMLWVDEKLIHDLWVSQNRSERDFWIRLEDKATDNRLPLNEILTNAN
jgi:hypothetical protein